MESNNTNPESKHPQITAVYSYPKLKFLSTLESKIFNRKGFYLETKTWGITIISDIIFKPFQT